MALVGSFKEELELRGRGSNYVGHRSLKKRGLLDTSIYIMLIKERSF